MSTTASALRSSVIPSAFISADDYNRISITPDDETLLRLHSLSGHMASALHSLIEQAFVNANIAKPEVTGVSNVVISFTTPQAIESVNRAMATHQVASANRLLDIVLAPTLKSVGPIASATPAFV